MAPLLAIVLLAGSSTLAAGSERPVRSAPAAAFQARLDALIRGEQTAPGAIAAFVLPDGTVGTASTGWADVEARVPMTRGTRLLGASVGKTFVAALVLGLEQDGVLRLDDPLERWIGDEPWFSRLPNARDVTLRMLLDHSSGLPDHVFLGAFARAALVRWATGRGDVAFAPRELVAFVLDREPLFPAGSGYAYSDTGYVLAGLVVERATGRAYYELLQERFLDPLELSLTLPSDRPRIPSLAPGYVEPLCWLPRVKTMRDGALRLDPATEWTGGGIATNPRDLARWAKALYEDRALPKPYLDRLLAAPRPVSETASYGLGSFVYRTRLGTAYGHGGWIPGYTASMLYFPGHRIAIAIQLNGDCGVRANRALHHAVSLAETIVGALRRPEPAAGQGADRP